MKKLERLSVLAIVMSAVSLSLLAGPARAGDEEPAISEEMQQEMMVWMKLAEPGPQHEGLAKYVGTWKGEVFMWMAPDMEPMVDSSTAEAEMILGGRYLEWTHTGSFSGMPYESRAIEAYSHLDKRYESIWIDNFGTLMLFFTGSGSEDGSRREMSTSFSDPVKGGTTAYRAVYEWHDEDHFSYITYMDKGEGEFKNMEIKFTRQ
jgi:hypothetical protein